LRTNPLIPGKVLAQTPCVERFCGLAVTGVIDGLLGSSRSVRALDQRHCDVNRRTFAHHGQFNAIAGSLISDRRNQA
jgi:hypothetical protein